MDDEHLRATIKSTIEWADELGELYVGTTTGSIIDFQKQSLEKSVESNDMKLAGILVLELAKTCECTEETDSGH